MATRKTTEYLKFSFNELTAHPKEDDSNELIEARQKAILGAAEEYGDCLISKGKGKNKNNNADPAGAKRTVYCRKEEPSPSDRRLYDIEYYIGPKLTRFFGANVLGNNPYEEQKVSLSSFDEKHFLQLDRKKGDNVLLTAARLETAGPYSRNKVFTGLFKFFEKEKKYGRDFLGNLIYQKNNYGVSVKTVSDVSEDCVGRLVRPFIEREAEELTETVKSGQIFGAEKSKWTDAIKNSNPAQGNTRY